MYGILATCFVCFLLTLCHSPDLRIRSSLHLTAGGVRDLVGFSLIVTILSLIMQLFRFSTFNKLFERQVLLSSFLAKRRLQYCRYIENQPSGPCVRITTAR